MRAGEKTPDNRVIDRLLKLKAAWHSKRTTGHALSEHEKHMLKDYFDEEVLACARIVEGRTPFWLRKCMNAVVLGDYIYFREGAYRPDTERGIELLGHELTHVQQFKSGMTILKYLWHSRRGYCNNCYEIEAHAKGAKIRRECFSFASHRPPS